MPQTAIEKIVQRYAVGLDAGAEVHAGDFVRIKPKHVMTHDNTGAVMPKFFSIFSRETGETPVPPDRLANTGETPVPQETVCASQPRIADPRQPVFGMDHDVQNTSPENLGKYAKIEKFARKHGIDYYPPGRGIAHQIMVEEGYVTPGSLVVASDSHSNIYGAIAALGTPVVRTDAAAIWATGETWWQVPDMARVTLTGRLRTGVTGKDVIITLCGFFNSDEVLNCAVEFTGAGVSGLSIEERLTISNMTTEWGALVGMFPFDERLRESLFDRAREFEERADRFSTSVDSGAKSAQFTAHRAAPPGEAPRYKRVDVERWWAQRESFRADPDCFYSRQITLDLSSVSPHVSGPDNVKTMTSVAELESQDIQINKAYLLSCVNARLEDLAQAAEVIRGRKVAPGVELYLAAASSEVMRDAKRLGYWDDLVNAGAIELPPGCGACIGLGRGTLKAGEVGVSATNRNFKGRMGSRDARCYLASPAVVAASAIAGRICAPTTSEGKVVSPVIRTKGTCTLPPPPAHASSTRPIRAGFPSTMSGRCVYLPQDNLNTDGIYGKDVTYRDDITFAQQGQYAMLNYDPEFQSIARRGDILIGGRNFGTGSSREQAATALASKGIQCVIAATFSQTYKRNAFNNGFICLECPALVDEMKRRFADVIAANLTIPGPQIEIDFTASTILLDDGEFPFPPLSPVAQELVAMGGAEAVVRERLFGGR